MVDVWIIVLLRLKKMNKYSKKILLLILFGFIILNIIVSVSNYFIDKKELNIMLNGIVEEYTITPKKFLDIKINNVWYNLSLINDELLNNIEKGDSIIKYNNSFQYEIYRKNKNDDFELIFKGEVFPCTNL